MSLTEEESKAYREIGKVFDKCENIKQIMTYVNVSRKIVGDYLAFTGKEVTIRVYREKLKSCDQFYFEDITGKELMRKSGLPYAFVMKYLLSKRSGLISRSNQLERQYKKGMSTKRLSNLSGIPYGAVYLWMCKRGVAVKYPTPEGRQEPFCPKPKRIDRKNKYPEIKLKGEDKLDYIKNNAKSIR